MSGSHSTAWGPNTPWVVENLGDQNGADDDEAGQKHDEDGWSVAHTREAVVELARLGNAAAR